jgi:flagellar biosynthesis/type III secretory pathway protein FliH
MLFDDDGSPEIRKVDFGKRSTKVERVQFGNARRPVLAEPQGLDEISAFVHENDQHQVSAELEAARHEGFEAGRAEATAEANEKITALMGDSDAALTRALHEVQEFAEDLTTKAQRIVIELARVFSESILERELVLPETVIDVTRAAVRRACGLEQIHIYVDPDSVELLTAQVKFLRDEDPTGATITIHADERFVPGDVRIMSDGGQIDGVMTDRLDRLVESAFSNISELFSEVVPDFDEPGDEDE